MLFDLPPGELPRATLRPRRSRARQMISAWSGDFLRWLGARWTWLRPRTIPLVAAFAGMLAVIASVDYLRTYEHHTHCTATATPVVVAAPSATSTGSLATVWVETGTRGVQLLMDQEPVTSIVVRDHDGALRPIPLAPGRNIIRLEPVAK